MRKWIGLALCMILAGRLAAQGPGGPKFGPGAFGGPGPQPMPGAFGPGMMPPSMPPGAFGAPGAFGPPPGMPAGPYGAFGPPMGGPGPGGPGPMRVGPGEPLPQPGPYSPPSGVPQGGMFNISPDPNKPAHEQSSGKHGLLSKITEKFGHKDPGEMPKGDFSLPNDGSPNAFECIEMCRDEGYYVNLGFMMMTRMKLGHSTLVVQDPSVTRVDTGVRPTADALELLNFNDINPNGNFGARATIGYRLETTAVELSGWYLADNRSWSLVADRGRLDLPFGSVPFVPPAGFAGTNNLFLQADVVRESLRTRMGSAEAVYRWGAGAGADWLLGLRYFYHSELFEILVEDERIPPNAFNPATAATYSIRDESNIFGPEIGFELEQPVLKGALGLGAFAKGTFGVNFNELVGRLQRTDGFTAPSVENRTTLFTQIYEAGLFLDVIFMDHIRLRGGYQLLWLARVPEVQAQVNYDLATSLLAPQPNYSGNILYHGPFVELQIAF